MVLSDVTRVGKHGQSFLRSHARLCNSHQTLSLCILNAPNRGNPMCSGDETQKKCPQKPFRTCNQGAFTNGLAQNVVTQRTTMTTGGSRSDGLRHWRRHVGHLGSLFQAVRFCCQKIYHGLLGWWVALKRWEGHNNFPTTKHKSSGPWLNDWNSHSTHEPHGF